MVLPSTGHGGLKGAIGIENQMQMVCLNLEAVISLYPLPSPLIGLTSSSSTCQGPLQKGCGLSEFLAFCPLVQGMGFRSSEVCLCPRQCAQTSELGSGLSLDQLAHGEDVDDALCVSS